MENKEQVYSIDGELYTDYCSMMDVLHDYHNIGENVEVWEADKKEYRHIDSIHIDDLIENMQTRAMDGYGEVAEEYLNDMNKDKRVELEIYIAEWFNKNAKIDFYGVENEHKIVVIVE